MHSLSYRNTACLISAVALLCSFMQSCQSGSEAIASESISDEQTFVNETESTVSETIGLKPTLPEVDMQGQPIRILSQSWCNFEPLFCVDISTEELNGDSLNDAVYHRNKDIENMLNCKIQHDSYTEQDQSFRKLQYAVTSGEDAYDLAFLESAKYVPAIHAEILTDIAEIPYINIENPWWDSRSYQDLSLFGKHYAVCSDMTTTDELAIWCTYFNKTMIKNYDLDNPYDLVSDGMWTLDCVFSMAHEAPADLNGDGLMEYGDQFGVTFIRDTIAGLFNSIGVFFAEADQDGVPQMTINSEQNLTRIQKLLGCLYNKDDCFNVHVRKTPDHEVAETGIFTDGQALFTFGGIYYARRMRQMDQDFGILPYPKYDETQPFYINSASPLFLYISCIPKTNSIPEQTGIFMEQYAYMGYETIRPAFYDGLLRGKVARDDESADMLDYIFSNVTYDIGAIFNFGNISSDMMRATNTYTVDFASFLAKREPKAKTAIEKLCDQLQSEN